jgi:hypothetical protein
MRERSEQWLRLLCLALGLLLVCQIGIKVLRRSPLSGLKIPELPTLAAADDSAPGGKGTNQSTVKAAGTKGTNSSPSQAGTNAVSHHKASTNLTAAAASPPSLGAETNAVRVSKERKGKTNIVAQAESSGASTNLASGTNAVKGTNLLAKASKSGKGTNANARAGMAMPGGPFGGPGMQKPPDLPPAVLARVDRLVDSELLGPVFHPMPTGLLGIVGDVAFLRAPSGQTGMVKEGDSLGAIKLVRIGINRVLVEEDGQKKELTIFEGFGGQSLLPN